MASMYISEYEDIGKDGKGWRAQMPLEPSVTTQKVTFTTAAASAAFNDNTSYICVHLDADGHVTFGIAPTATVSHKKLIANTDYYFAVIKGQKVSAYDGSS